MRLRATVKNGVSRLFWRCGLTTWAQRRPGVVVLLFHKIREQQDSLGLSIPPRVFDGILQTLGEDHQFIPPETVVERAREGSGRLRLAVTFDDGYRDNYEFAYPILRRHAVPATVFLSTDQIDGRRPFWYERMQALADALQTRDESLRAQALRGLGLTPTSDREDLVFALDRRLKELPSEQRDALLDALAARLGHEPSATYSPMLNWDQVREMAAHGIGFGSHSRSHPILSREPMDRVVSELEGSRRIIEDRLGTEVTAFAYPNGRWEDIGASVRQAVRDAGYRQAFSTIPGRNRGAVDPFLIKRLNVTPQMCVRGDGGFNRPLFLAKVTGIL